MTTRHQRFRTRSRRLDAAAAAAGVLLAGALYGLAPADRHASGVRTAAPAGEGGGRPAAADHPAVPVRAHPPLSRSAPVRVRIPQLGTDAEVLAAGPADDGEPPAPEERDADKAAWHRSGPSPGERGAALLVGHLANADGTAAFARLDALRTGTMVEVERADGRTAVFTVNSVERYAPSFFPARRVYGAADTPQLRLVTCTNAWGVQRGHDHTVVAYAVLTGTAGSGAG